MRRLGRVKVASVLFDDEAKDGLIEYIARLRALHLWFHGAHHLTHGSGYSGDHAELFDRIYTEIQDEVDGAVEKAVGVTNDPTAGCPLRITKDAAEILCEYESPARLSARDIAAEGLKMEKAYIVFLEGFFKYLEDQDMLTLGLNDAIAASANTHETYVYLLQQRVRDDGSAGRVVTS